MKRIYRSIESREELEDIEKQIEKNNETIILKSKNIINNYFSEDKYNEKEWEALNMMFKHIQRFSEVSFISPFISLTMDFTVALKYYDSTSKPIGGLEHELGIISIDLDEDAFIPSNYELIDGSSFYDFSVKILESGMEKYASFMCDIYKDSDKNKYKSQYLIYLLKNNKVLSLDKCELNKLVYKYFLIDNSLVKNDSPFKFSVADKEVMVFNKIKVLKKNFVLLNKEDISVIVDNNINPDQYIDEKKKVK